MREVYGYYVSRYDPGDLGVPDECRIDKASVGPVIGGTEQVPAPAERIRDEADEGLPLDEQVGVVVGHLVSDGDRHERVHVRHREPSGRHVAKAEDLAELDHPKV